MAPYRGIEPITTQNKTTSGRPKWIMVALGVFGIVALAVALYFLFRVIFVKKISGGGTLTQASAGSLVSNFPKEFLLEEGVQIKESYSIAYNASGVKQPVATYASKLQMGQNILNFRTLLAEQGWTIVQDANAHQMITFIYAEKDNYKKEVNITFQEVKGVVTISISYVER